MSDPKRNDEGLLIDYMFGRCEQSAAEQVRGRLARDEAFRALHQELANAFALMRPACELEPPDDLVVKTLARIEAARRTEVLLAREELTRPALRATFSLRELTAGAAAVLVLAVIFIPSIRQARSRARINECASQAGQIGTALQTYANAHNGFPVADQSLRWLPGEGAPAASNSKALFKLVQLGVSPVLFQCPAVGGRSFEVKASMADFPAGDYVGYSYQHSLGGRGLPAMEAVASPESMAILADSNPVFRNGRFNPARLYVQTSDNHGGSGQNVLYLDRHVAWAEKPDVGVSGDNIYLCRGVVNYRGDEVPAGPTDSFLLPSFSESR